ncbi:MAG TPA: class I SAM-dependent methyltransferase [Solirubrobacteraceae bacterium]|nr:class I SAM-dependent methyltransferase [Solirubrobacteraceae bacterium]
MRGVDYDETSLEYARHVGAQWARRETAVRSWWQSPVVVGEIQRRVTGEANKRVEEYFRDRYCPTPFGRALSLCAGGGQMEQSMLELGVCQEILGIDISEARVEHANAAIPDVLHGRLAFECHNLETWRPDGQFDLLLARDVLHHITRLEELCEALEELLPPGSLLYVDEYVGPARFQWTDRQLEVIERLLGRLSPPLVADLVEPALGSRRHAQRPTIESMIAADPSESVRSDEITAILGARFDVVERRPYGGAVFHQLFNRIMGNFVGQDDLVRTLMEIDFLLCDEGVLETNYEWGVYRTRG